MSLQQPRDDVAVAYALRGDCLRYLLRAERELDSDAGDDVRHAEVDALEAEFDEIEDVMMVAVAKLAYTSGGTEPPPDHSLWDALGLAQGEAERELRRRGWSSHQLLELTALAARG
jgi:hypothetical protein